jgi:hypothetical protein
MKISGRDSMPVALSHVRGKIKLFWANSRLGGQVGASRQAEKELALEALRGETQPGSDAVGAAEAAAWEGYVDFEVEDGWGGVRGEGSVD